MGKKLNSRQRCASDVAGDVAGDKSLAIGVHFRFGPCTYRYQQHIHLYSIDGISKEMDTLVEIYNRLK